MHPKPVTAAPIPVLEEVGIGVGRLGDVFAGDEEVDQLIERAAPQDLGEARHSARALGNDGPDLVPGVPLPDADERRHRGRALHVVAVTARARGLVERVVVVRHHAEQPGHLVRIDVVICFYIF